MGKNTFTSWLVVTGKDFKVLWKNRPLLLIYLGVIVALIVLAIFQGTYLFNELLQNFDASKYLPSLPNYMIYFVIFTSALFMMNQGPVSFTNENKTGIINRLKIMNIGYGSVIFGKLFFFYIAALIQVLLFNVAATILFLAESSRYGLAPMNWDVMQLLNFVLLWPLIMVLGAFVLYLLISMFIKVGKK
ncbi:MAG TPA: hypothetical protein PKV16_02865 [Caldisericia bacterium]|nr:hypothetical protein [Caldisericia bacterium]HPF48254.1 hypothetical protein [Caldisericia bacterium]HPI83810.1 hypothetical protein [Caldisericia bacterium]HPQ92707.1 hypothetical protein [Caldisericia bacterium]HRV74195.1 hypothetical protein [Caldisericia bacterium]